MPRLKRKFELNRLKFVAYLVIIMFKPFERVAEITMRLQMQ